MVGRLALKTSYLLSYLTLPRWPRLPYMECQGLKSDDQSFQSWNFGTKADKSEVVRKLQQIRIYSEGFQQKRLIFVTLVRVTKFGVLSGRFCTYGCPAVVISAVQYVAGAHRKNP